MKNITCNTPLVRTLGRRLGQVRFITLAKASAFLSYSVADALHLVAMPGQKPAQRIRMMNPDQQSGQPWPEQVGRPEATVEAAEGRERESLTSLAAALRSVGEGLITRSALS